ncbi:ATP dependent DNA ligase [Planctomicrobium piriforme]|nr:hypothetical protein [Planctomicrobium piriforme]
MLDSVRLEKTVEAPVAKAASTPSGCAQCGSTESWGAASWCPNCGYYPKLGRNITPAELPEMDGTAKLKFDFAWIIWTAVGLLFIIAGSVALRLCIPDVAERAPYGRIQCILGFVILVIAQVRAFIIASHKTDAIPLTAFFCEPFQLWAAVFKALPGSRQVIYKGCWGAMTLILALSVVGLDLDGMFSHLTKKKKKPKVNPLQMIVKAASAVEGKTAFSGDDEEGGMSAADIGGGGGPGNGNPGNIEDAIKDLAGSANGTGVSAGGAGKRKGDPAKASTIGDEKPVPNSPSGEKRTERGDFRIFGYLTNPAGEIRSVLLASVENNRGRFVGKLSLEELDEETRDRLQDALDAIRTTRPALKSAFNARWVKPIVVCQVAFTGMTNEGTLREGYLISYADSQSDPNNAEKTNGTQVTR